MKSRESRSLKRRLRSSYITSVISISLVLFMLGLIGILLLNTRQISILVKENIGFSVILKETVNEADILRLQKNLDARRYIKSTEYITKERAAREFQKELGEDFVSFLGYNPLLSSIEVKLYAAYANTDSISMIEKDLKKYEQIKEVHYQKSLVHLINENIRRISLAILLFSGLLLIVAIFLINNTIRLSIYSKRFVINTMQLVGATNSFIRKPFLWRSFLNGIYGAAVATGLIVLTLFWAEKQLDDIVKLTNPESIAILCVVLLAIGIIINIVSTWFAVNKSLKLRNDDLYY
ncbi:MAG: permease-like cell division protein FtsX [Bacteroidota bacterium]|nr:permease-like cell division protein FtsX [Bacteroidota bacterium]